MAKKIKNNVDKKCTFTTGGLAASIVFVLRAFPVAAFVAAPQRGQTSKIAELFAQCFTVSENSFHMDELNITQNSNRLDGKNCK